MRLVRSTLVGIVLMLATWAHAANVSITADVVYGHKDGMALVYDVFAPAKHNGAAVLFMVSGGWFSRWVPPEQRQGWIQHLLDEGFTVFTVHHGSAPRFKVPDAVADVRRAVRHVRMNATRFDIDPDRLGAFGGSAGGHLSLMLGLASDDGDEAAEDPVLRLSNRIQAVVALYAPVDIGRILALQDRFPALNIDPQEAPAISPIKHVTADDPPVLMIHGDQDALILLSHSERMGAALDAAGVANKVIIVEGAGHGFREPAHRALAQRETVAFFKAHLLMPFIKF